MWGVSPDSLLSKACDATVLYVVLAGEAVKEALGCSEWLDGKGDSCISRGRVPDFSSNTKKKQI